MSTLDEAAAYLTLSSRWLSELISRGVIARQPPGQYDLTTCLHEYLTHLRVTGTVRKLPDRVDLDFVIDAVWNSLYEVPAQAGPKQRAVEEAIGAAVEQFRERCYKYQKGTLRRLVDEETVA